jgi:ABC-type enterochelin transport system permease subunit
VFKVPVIALVSFTLGGAAVGWYLGTRRVNRRSVFGDDHIGSQTHRRIMRRRHLMRLVSLVLYGIAGAIAGLAFLMVTRR